jgi:DNA polymerase-4
VETKFSHAGHGLAVNPLHDVGVSERAIAHVDIDAFFASVEKLRYPHLRSKPVIVGNGVIASCCYEARKYGCYAGQPLSEARRMCPQVVILDGCEAIYHAFAKKTFKICSEFSPAMETFLDEAVIDFTGCDRLGGGLEEQARNLKHRIRDEVGLPVTIGMGANRMLAKIAGKSAKPNGLCWIQEKDIESVLPGLPIDRLPGVGRSIGKQLSRFNVSTIGDLRAFDAALLEQLFGANGRQLYDRCRGLDTRPVDTHEVPLSISRETAFHQPVTNFMEVEGMLYYLQERAARHARDRELHCRTVRVWIDYEASGRAAISRSLSTPSNQDDEIFRLARTLLKGLFTRREAVRRVGLSLSRFLTDTADQVSLFGGDAQLQRQKLTASLDLVRERYGHAAVVAGPSVRLMHSGNGGEGLKQDRNGFVLRTPSLTK